MIKDSCQIVYTKAQNWIWSRSKRLIFVRRALQILIRMLERVLEEEFRERAQSLAYTTLLSLVPLIAVSFSVLKSFDVHQKMIPFLEEAFKPLGKERAPEAIATLIGFVDNVKVSVLGGVGLALLFYTVVSLLTSIESQFNKIWEIKEGRSFGRRITDYIVMVILGPVMAVAALSVFSSHFISRILQHVPDSLIHFFGKAVSLSILTIIMAFLYSFITHRKVNLIPSLIGGFFTSVCWFAIGSLFTKFVSTSNNYSGIYSGFASVILFMLWTYISWLIILLGNQLACYLQCPEKLLSHPNYNHLPPRKINLSIELEEIDPKTGAWKVCQIEPIDR